MHIEKIEDYRMPEILYDKAHRLPKKNLLKIIDAFIDSGNKMVEIKFTEYDYKNAKSCVSSFANTARKSNRNIKAIMRHGRVFLMRLEPDE